MAAASCFLGIDMHRSGLELILIDQQGSTRGFLRRQFSGREPAEDGDQDPQDWWRATRTGIKELLRRCGLEARAVRAVGVTAITDGAVLVGTEGQVLGPANLGCDGPAEAALERLLGTVGARNLSNLTGRRPNPRSLAVKLLRQSELQPRTRHDVMAILQPADFLRFRLTGETATDPSTACRSLLMSPRNRSWSKQLLGQIGIDPRLLPTIVPGPQLIGRVHEAAARESGLPCGTPVIAGASPQAAAAVAIGASEPGDLVIDLGRDGSTYCLCESPQRDTSGHLDLGCHCCDQLWCLEAEGVSPTTGISWLMDTVLPGEVQQAKRNKRSPLDHFAEMAAETKPGADGLLFIGPDGGACSGFLGLRSDHDRGHLVRAVFEAGALSARSLIDHLTQLRCRPERVLLTGPGATNPLWCQMLADATDLEVRSFPQEGVAAHGCALMAAVATGAHRSLDQARKKGPKPEGRFKARRAAQQAYAEIGPRRDAIISALDNEVLNGTSDVSEVR